MRELLQLDVHEQLKITALGLKLFERQDSKVGLPEDFSLSKIWHAQHLGCAHGQGSMTSCVQLRLMIPVKVTMSCFWSRLWPCRTRVQDARSRCLYRIAQEGLPLLLPAMTRQLLPLARGRPAAPAHAGLPAAARSPTPAHVQAGQARCPALHESLTWPPDDGVSEAP